jgi:AraC-like DNA-binding protein
MLVKNNKISKINIMRFMLRDDKPFGFCVYPPGATLGPRVLADYEIVWIESGSAVWVHNGEEYNLMPGSILLAKPGDRETFFWDKNKHTSHYFYHFSLNKKEAPPLKIYEDESLWPFLHNLPQNNVLKPMVMNAFRLIKNGRKDSDPILQSMLQQILLTFISGCYEVEQETPDDLPPAIERVFQYIHSQWNQLPLIKPDLETLAAKALVSPTHLCRLFNEAFEMSPVQTITTMRLKRASTLLVRTNYPLKRISYLTGFENQYHFSRLFKKVYGISPSEYRKDTLQIKPLPRSSIIAKRL